MAEFIFQRKQQDRQAGSTTRRGVTLQDNRGTNQAATLAYGRPTQLVKKSSNTGLPDNSKNGTDNLLKPARSMKTKTIQLVPGYVRKANAKKAAAKRRKEAAQQKEENRNWWRNVLLGGMLLSGTAIELYNRLPGRANTGVPRSGNNPSPGSTSNDLSRTFENNTPSASDSYFRGNETVALQQRLRQLERQPVSCSIIRDMDAVKLQQGQLNSMSLHDYRHTGTSPLNPSEGKGHVAGMVGLPGSGKSTLMAECTGLGYVGEKEFDDIGQNPKQLDSNHRWWNPFSWPRKLPPQIVNWPDQRAPTSVKAYAEQGTNVVMSDPEFVKKQERDNAEQKVGRPITWAFFENNAQQAEDNAKFRHETASSDYDKRRNLPEEIRKIRDLSSQYDLPNGEPTHKVVNARKYHRKKKAP